VIDYNIFRCIDRAGASVIEMVLVVIPGPAA